MIEFFKSVTSIDLINLGLTFVKYIYYTSKISLIVPAKNKKIKSQAMQIDLHIGKEDFIFDFHLNR